MSETHSLQSLTKRLAEHCDHRDKELRRLCENPTTERFAQALMDELEGVVEAILCNYTSATMNSEGDIVHKEIAIDPNALQDEIVKGMRSQYRKLLGKRYTPLICRLSSSSGKNAEAFLSVIMNETGEGRNETQETTDAPAIVREERETSAQDDLDKG